MAVIVGGVEDEILGLNTPLLSAWGLVRTALVGLNVMSPLAGLMATKLGASLEL